VSAKAWCLYNELYSYKGSSDPELESQSRGGGGLTLRKGKAPEDDPTNVGLSDSVAKTVL